MLVSGMFCKKQSLKIRLRSALSDRLQNCSHSKRYQIRNFSEAAEKQYEKLSPTEHILIRPGMYVGQVQPLLSETWLVNKELNIMKKEAIMSSPALVKIFDEILVNAADNKQSDGKMSAIGVSVGRSSSGGIRISVRNNGKGIPTSLHATEKIHIPELIFGHLLTGSNFNDEQSRVVGGRHGYGAKLTNIYSDLFEVETYDSKRETVYKQQWQKNMSIKGDPSLTRVKRSKEHSDYTEITFEPDLSRFFGAESASASREQLIENTMRLFERRTYDMAGTLKGVKVSFNGSVVPVQTFEDYVKMHGTIASEDDPQGTESAIVYGKINDRWEVAVTKSSGSFDCVAFVNNVWTSKGGTHVSLVTDQRTPQVCSVIVGRVQNSTIAKDTFFIKFEIVKAVESSLGAKKASSNASFLKNRLMVFVNCQVENPDFDNQSKDFLTSTNTVTLDDCKLPKTFLDNAVKRLGLVDDMLQDILMREKRKLLRAATTKTVRSSILDVPKLQDAQYAATNKSMDCTLILTEGDSAMALAVAGLEVVGRQNFGVLPLKGKILNVRVASTSQMRHNAELINLCKSLGLDFDKTYENGIKGQGLRYGKVMIMCDQDNDGSHIKGLVINFFQHFWPHLLKNDGFLQQFVTPLVKVREKAVISTSKNDKTKKKKEDIVQSFYSIPEYEEWRERHRDDVGYMKKQQIKYYKGLGTNTADEGKAYFGDLVQHKKLFHWGPGDLDAIDLAFSGSRAKDRRAWLSKDYDSSMYISHATNSITYEEFVRKELIHFSFADNKRSIPSVIDGLKPSQRKVLFGCFKKKLDGEMKVVQLAGYIADKTCYHHGEQSLYLTIVNMAQDFVGSNNVPLLTAAGQFGTRARGGKDFASPRYIYTQLTPMARALYPEADDALLNYLEEDGVSVEPKYFIPVVPVLLLNGSSGIGTGWSTNIPPYSPVALAEHVIARVRGQTSLPPLVPWGKGFVGEMIQDGARFITNGVISRTSDTALEEALDAYQAVGLLETFKLTKSISLSNMHAFDSNGVIRKYSSPEEMVEEFLPIRMEAYKKRKEALMKMFAADEAVCRNKCRFISEILSGDLDVLQKNGRGAVAETDLVNDLKKRSYLSSGEIQEMRGPRLLALSDADSDSDTTSGGSDSEPDDSLITTSTSTSTTQKSNQLSVLSSKERQSYAYLLDLPIRSLTDVRVAALRRDAEQSRAKLEQLEKTSETDLWLADLETLIVTHNSLHQ